MLPLSYVSGPADEPLLGETIGDNLDRIAAAQCDALCLIARHQGVRWTYGEFAARVDECARAFLALGVAHGDRVGIWSPNRVEWTLVQYAHGKIGAILVTINPAYRAHEVEYALAQSGTSVLVVGERLQDLELRRHASPRCARSLPRLQTLIFLDSEAGELTWTPSSPARPGCRRTTCARAEATAAVRRRRSTSSTPPAPPASRRARRSRTTISSTTRYFITGIQAATAGRPALRAGPALPLLRHGDGQPRLHDARRGDRLPARRPSTRGAVLEAVERSAAPRSTACRPCSSPMLDHPDFARPRPVVAAHRRDGGRTLPDRGHEARASEMHMREVTICYGMTETLAGLVPDAPRRSARAPRRHGRSRSPARRDARSSTRDSGAVVPRGEPGELWTRGYCVMLGYWKNDAATARGDRRGAAGCTPAISPSWTRTGS